MANTSRTKPGPKRSTAAAPRAATQPAADIPVVGPREPCPCGSGRRYKACHGRPARAAATQFVARPFEGLASEPDWVALREFVPAGRARLTPADADAAPTTAATLLPMIAPGAVTRDGEWLLALQTQGGSLDPSRDYGAALERLADVEPGNLLDGIGAPGPGSRLQDLLDPAAPLQVEVLDSFDFWLDAVDDPGGLIASSIERANAAIIPTTRLSSVEAAYWCREGERAFLRWALPEPEDAVVDALARLHVAGADLLGERTRQIGAFRAHGLLVAVWDLPSDPAAETYEEAAAAFAARYADAVRVSAPLTPAERSARSGLLNRQRTIR
jgi:hypothetical protein